MERKKNGINGAVSGEYVILDEQGKKIHGYGYGYVRPSDTIERLLDFTLSFILLTIGSPLFLLIAVAVKLCDGGPVFYTQSRLGFKKTPFTIYKFRTLVPNADKIIGPRVLSKGRHNLVTPVGKFLRNTRLDELPQLFNLLKGDMTFFGPRPQRPEIVEHFGSHIKDYDKRFTVKPGLIGFPQLFLPHSAPKSIQSRIDNMYLHVKQNYFWGILLVFFTIYNVTKKFIRLTIKRFRNLLLRIGSDNYREKRVFERKRVKSGNYVFFSRSGREIGHTWEKKHHNIYNVNDEALLIRTRERLNFEDNFLMKIVIEDKIYGKLKRKTIYCKGTLFSERKTEKEFEYVIFYEPLSPLNYYLAHQYLLRNSLAYG